MQSAYCSRFPKFTVLNKFQELSNLILEGDLKKPSLGAICLLQSVPQIHFFKFQEISNLILEGDLEKPSLGAICLLQSVPQIHFF